MTVQLGDAISAQNLCFDIILERYTLNRCEPYAHKPLCNEYINIVLLTVTVQRTVCICMTEGRKQ